MPRDVAAAIYCRVSSKGQEDGTSLPTQEEACRTYCEEHGYQVDESNIYRDVQTGAILNRPALERLREQIRSGHIRVAVVYAIDRLSRDQTHLGVLIYEADEHDVKLEFVTEQLDDTPAGQFLRQALGFVASIEHEKIKERTQRGRKARARAGKLIPGSFPLYGYQWGDEEKATYAPDPETAPIVQRIYREVAAGTPVNRLCWQLTTEGVPTPTQILMRRGYVIGRMPSGSWQKSTVNHLLRHPAYGGRATAYRYENTYRKEKDPQTGLVRRIRVQTERNAEDEDRIALPLEACPALVDAETVAAVRVRLARNKEEAARRNTDPEGALLRGGYIVCGYCGAAMHAYRATGGRAAQYMCGRRRNGFPSTCQAKTITVHRIDQVVWDQVKRALMDRDHITQALERRRVETTEAEAQGTATLAAVEGRLRQLEQRGVNLTSAIAEANTVETRFVLTQALDGLAVQRRSLEAERAKLESESAWRTESAAQLASLEAWAGTVAGRLDEFDYNQKRLALYALGVRVQVWGTDHEPRYRISFNFDGFQAGVDVTSLAGDPGSEQGSGDGAGEQHCEQANFCAWK